MAKSIDKIYSVSQLTSLIKAAIESNLPGRITVAGQVTDLKGHQSGHCYFSLKDENAKLPCVMWKSNFDKVKFDCENGLEVAARGFIDVYPPHGRYQFMVEKLEPVGVGALQLAFEKLFEKLKTEGLFDDKYKKPLPRYPERIGILTSASGAAVEDIKNSIFNRWPCAKLFLYPVPVQGEGAAEKIAAGLDDINKRNAKLKLEVLIVGRGGGSMEDLWAFNEEILARAIFKSKIPIISAVGHEVDTTIADLVADARASTPTKAGVIAVPDMQEVLEQLDYIERELSSRANWVFKLAKESLQGILGRAVFFNPLLPILNRTQQLDEEQIRLISLMRETLGRVKANLSQSYEQVGRIEPHRLLGRKTAELNDLQNKADRAVNRIFEGRRLQLTAAANRLEPLNPKSVLKRGYSITTSKKTGCVIKNLSDISIGDSILTELAGENLVESKVVKK